MILFSKKNMKISPDIIYKEAKEESKDVFDQKAFNNLIDAMEKARLAEYANYLAHPYRLLGMNFLIGLARGLGGTLGLAVILAGVGVIVKNIILLNLPGISEWVAQIVATVGKINR